MATTIRRAAVKTRQAAKLSSSLTTPVSRPSINSGFVRSTMATEKSRDAPSRPQGKHNKEDDLQPEQLVNIPSSSPRALREIVPEPGLIQYIRDHDMAARPLSRTQAQSILSAPNVHYWGDGKQRFERTGAAPSLDLLFSLPLRTVTCVTEDQFPDEHIPEVAIAGRSNVGKSTLMASLPLCGPGAGLAHLEDKPKVGPRPGNFLPERLFLLFLLLFY